MEDKEITEKKRLRILEQTLSQKLRLSNARRQIGKESGSIRKEIGKKSGTSSLLHTEERASSDSELIVKRNVSPRGLTPPVELIGGGDIDEDDRGLRTQLMVNMFKDNHKLQKVKRIQAERETNGPSFTPVCNNLALPARFTSTKCAWLRIEDLSEHFGDIAGCLSAVVSQTSSADKRQVMEQTQEYLGKQLSHNS
ncbi:Hypothetical predicted protein [Paramuricea clavata]|uniref:Uncharacterized protein n=1 Tax=Paramuricea clavata TaxID=317549 RepID=A0A6S7I7R9_PARCT|nr:Hypothetical predicted protein [Paramuricea clavata]